MNQIVTVMRFEILKNRKKFFILFIVELLIWFSLAWLPYLITNIPFPATISLFMESSFPLYSILMYILGIAYGCSLISDEFGKRTGFMLFPKVSKTRLFIGKFMSQYLLFALNITIYYFLILISSIANYTSQIPNTFYYSYLFSLLYAVVLFSFVLVFSSFLKSTVVVVIISIVLLFIGFSILSAIVGLGAHQIDPIFDITYLGRIIIYVFNFPNPRYIDTVIPISSTEKFTSRTWITPLLNVGAIMMVIYSAIFIVVAYLFFLRRESKG